MRQHVVAWVAIVLAVCSQSLEAAVSAKDSSGLRVATFRCDATPPLGEPVIWDIPLKEVESPLWAKGIVLAEGRRRYVICTLDWCELCNDSELALRQSLAAAARTEISRVAIHCLHQHTAPYADAAAHLLLDSAPNPPLHLSRQFLETLGQRLGEAVQASLAHLQPFDRVGTGAAKVGRVASTRRLHGRDGRIVVRYSEGARNPAMATAPEGDIDPMLRTVTLAQGRIPLVRLHYYATHPQTFSCTGQASSDFVGHAREAREGKEHVFQIYFTGCSGDVTVGKYNNGTPEARRELSQRLLAGMEASIAATRFSPIRHLNWRSVPLKLPPRTDVGFTLPDYLARVRNTNAAPGARIYGGAMRAAYIERAGRPLPLSSLQLGDVFLLHLPGEPMLEFQKYAVQLRPKQFVAVAGYCDCGPGYICTDRAFAEGGYEPSAGSTGLVYRFIEAGTYS